MDSGQNWSFTSHQSSMAWMMLQMDLLSLTRQKSKQNGQHG